MAEKTIDDNKNVDGDKDKSGEKDLGEELAGKDTSKFTPKEMIEYIDSLKDENAKRRIKSRKLEDALQAATEKLGKMESDLAEQQKKIASYDEEKKKAADAEKTEVERLASEVADLKGKISSYEKEIADSQKKLSAKDQLIAEKQRETMVERLVFSAGVKFSSDYERTGFLSSLLVTNSNGQFELNDEEVIQKVTEFVKKNKEAPSVPGPGPTNRSLEASTLEQIKNLTSKRNLTGEDMKTLNELLERTGEADRVLQGPPPNS